MVITDTKAIEAIQTEFNNKFPYLKIEFYKKAHGMEQGSKPDLQWDVNHQIGDIRSKHNEGDLSISGSLKIGEMESIFEDKYGLHIQVFYKSRGVWLQTTTSDALTLDQLNQKGEQFAS